MPDALWERIEPILLEDAPPPPEEHGGRGRIDWRAAFDGIISRPRSGCQWHTLPREYGDDSPVHRWSQRRCRHGVFERIRALLVEECDELGEVQWRWQAADGRPGKAPGSGGKQTGPDPTDRAKPGTKQGLLVEGDGGPLGVVIAGANAPDFTLLEATIRAVVTERPDPEQVEQHLCLDAGYDNGPARGVAEGHGYVPHIRPARGGPRPERRPGRRKARRWVVERTLAWLSKCRGLLVRYDEHEENSLGLIQPACGLLWYRRLHRIRAA
ncbi:IS5 family transposase [Tautonia plasticadhaerens]|uniref:IS5 family transposase n=1 Tax=Tautonia plasticadhaerens TaxID=2527974 RepID=UPI0011A6AC9D|nr:IS5 family transposase [Tautonia plasticadhaerens]